MPLEKGSNTSSLKSQRVSSNSGTVNQQMGDSNKLLSVIDSSTFETLKGKNVLSVNDPRFKALLGKAVTKNTKASYKSATSEEPSVSQPTAAKTLYLGMPLDLLGEQYLFGGVITKVSDKENEMLGGLKLTDLPPVHVRPQVLTFDDGTAALVLAGCPGDCDEYSQELPLLALPIVGFDQKTGVIYMDLASLGGELDFMKMIDPNGDYTQLKSVKSEVETMEYSLSTLVFDIKSSLIPVTTKPEDKEPKVTEVTTRWYLRLNSAFNPAFKVREPTEGVGFFTTSRSKETKITRFTTTKGEKSIIYYIKNVPEEWKHVFKNSLDNWNKEFVKLLGRELISYEFVDKDSPLSNQLVAGDIRYNVIEWDLNNIAPYGGLGPSVANQFTGEILNANVLIQGPKIIELYTKWFKVSEQARALKLAGNSARADQIVKNFHTEIDNKVNKLKQVKFQVKLGDHLTMDVRSQMNELSDPLIEKEFEVVPEGVTFQTYMDGYFQEMIEHEIGHNLGLRHNFKGSLGSSDSKKVGSVSRSIMEYLGRPYRHLNAIGLYDKMAIQYGYQGLAPKHLDWFCTDEDQPSSSSLLALAKASAECSKSDATSDPFSFWEARLSRMVNLVVDSSSSAAPVWTVKDVEDKVDDVVTAFASYSAGGASDVFKTWTNFFNKSDRPENASDISHYVFTKLKDILCDQKIADVIKTKETADASQKAQANLNELVKKITENKAYGFAFGKAEDFKCE